MPPKAVRRKTIYLEILLKAILALKDLKTDELCAEDHVLNVFFNFSHKISKFTVTAYFVMLLLTDIAITL